jgi:hypothetical protein
MFELRPACTLVLFATAVAILPAPLEGLREFQLRCLRPARLPFAWQGLTTAMASGTAQEVIGRGQQIAQLVPRWTAGQAAFVYRYVLSQDLSQNPEDAAKAAEKRLRAGLLMLDEARESAGKRGLSLLSSAAYLPGIACSEFPGLAERLRPTGGAASIADNYFRVAARDYPSPAVLEERLWHAPKLVEALLACGAKTQALAVLDNAIERAIDIRDQELATEWQDLLLTVANWLRGRRDLKLDAVAADPRFQPLLPYLR